MPPAPFYLGKTFDLESEKTQDTPLAYEPSDLTTHGMVVGMTGSGKTGLCIGLLEEAALNGIPALMVDPKGDLTNLLLHFPNLAPADFQPWLDPEEVRRMGKPIETAAAETAALWKNGLAGWGIAPERLTELKNSAHFAIFTPGSDAGFPVSILASLKAPPIPWEGNREILREKIGSTVTALLGLVGIKDIDPVRSREHILLSNIFETAWSQGHDLDLTELIMQTQTPPFERLGVFPVDKFYPEADRFELAMLLNNFLAAPAFQSWIEGQPLDIPSLLYAPDGKPRHSVFYIAHLDDTERMFFVTLLLSTFEAWMRSQSGTGSLRALLYFDEILGYMPPVANPPSKMVLLRMLKQARAFGVGLLLASQNPVDIDYKALSNAGSWFIGKLQTDQDKQRLLDGLESSGEAFNRTEMDKLISGLGKRVFLLKDVHRSKSELFQTRWAMNYLAGPLTRAQIPAANRLADAGETLASTAKAASASPAAAPIGTGAAATVAGTARIEAAPTQPASVVTGTQASTPGTATRPAAPAGVNEYFMPNNLTLGEALQSGGTPQQANLQNSGILYHPALLAQASVRYLDRRVNLDYEERKTALVRDPGRRGSVRWEENSFTSLDPQLLERSPLPQARFTLLEAPFDDARQVTALERDFTDWVYRASQIRLRTNAALKVYAAPDVSEGEFRKTCSQAAQQACDAELAKTGSAFDKKIALLADKLTREQRELGQDEDELSQRKMEEYGSYGQSLLSLFGKRRVNVSSSLTKRRLTQKSKADVDESKQVIADLTKQIAELEKAKAAATQEINERWASTAATTGEETRAALKKDIFLDLFGLVWLPYYVMQ
ncbi:MAG: DUF853 family protein, partial [Chloroflexi bacterium]|nr:DUF853 family protein [Chloroflexota bacterium]